MTSGSNNPENGAEESGVQRRVREAAEQAARSWLDPRGWGFFTWIVVLFAGFLGFSETGRGWLGQALNWLTENIPGVGNLAGRLGLLPSGVSEASQEFPEEFERVQALARSHRINIADGASAFMEPALLFDMMTQTPNFLRRTVQGMRGGQVDAAVMQRAMTAVQAIVNDPQKLGTLLSPQHRGNTFTLLEALSPIPLAPGNLGRFIQQVGMNGDQLKPEMRQFLNAMLDSNQETRSRAFTQFMLTVDPGAVRTLLAGVDLAQIQDPQLRQYVQQAQQVVANTTNARALQSIERDMQAAGSSLQQVGGQLFDPQGNFSVSNLVTYMLNGGNRDVIRNNTGRLGMLAESTANDPQAQAQFTASQITMMRFLGTRARLNDGRDHAINMSAMFQMVDAIGRNPANQNDHARRTHAVLTGMLGLMSGDAPAAGLLNTRNLSEFFSVPGNAQAFGTMLRRVRTNHLPQNLATMVTTLRDHWGNANGGIVDVLDNPEAINYILRHIGSGRSLAQSLPYGVQSFLGGLMGVPDDVRQNLSHLDAVRETLQLAGVTLGSGPVFAPRTGGNGQNRS